MERVEEEEGERNFQKLNLDRMKKRKEKVVSFGCADTSQHCEGEGCVA